MIGKNPTIIGEEGQLKNEKCESAAQPAPEIKVATATFYYLNAHAI